MATFLKKPEFCNEYFNKIYDLVVGQYHFKLVDHGVIFKNADFPYLKTEREEHFEFQKGSCEIDCKLTEEHVFVSIFTSAIGTTIQECFEQNEYAVNDILDHINQFNYTEGF